MSKAVLKEAYFQSKNRLVADPTITSAATSAGFFIPRGQKKGHRKGYQVFVKVCRFDETLLKRKPETGGLLSKP